MTIIVCCIFTAIFSFMDGNAVRELSPELADSAGIKLNAKWHEAQLQSYRDKNEKQRISVLCKCLVCTTKEPALLLRTNFISVATAQRHWQAQPQTVGFRVDKYAFPSDLIPIYKDFMLGRRYDNGERVEIDAGKLFM